MALPGALSLNLGTSWKWNSQNVPMRLALHMNHPQLWPWTPFVLTEKHSNLRTPNIFSQKMRSVSGHEKNCRRADEINRKHRRSRLLNSWERLPLEITWNHSRETPGNNTQIPETCFLDLVRDYWCFLVTTNDNVQVPTGYVFHPHSEHYRVSGPYAIILILTLTVLRYRRK